MTESWSARHVTLANPREDGSTDLPRLLRRVASHMEALDIQPLDILDLTISSEITGDGPWWSATLYWSPDDSTSPTTPVHPRSHATSGMTVRLRAPRDERVLHAPRDDRTLAAAHLEYAGASAESF